MIREETSRLRVGCSDWLDEVVRILSFRRGKNDLAVVVENLNAGRSICGDLKLYSLFTVRICKRDLCVLVLVLNRDSRPMLRSGFFNCSSGWRWVQNLEARRVFLAVVALEPVEPDRLCCRIVEGDE